MLTWNIWDLEKWSTKIPENFVDVIPLKTCTKNKPRQSKVVAVFFFFFYYISIYIYVIANMLFAKSDSLDFPSFVAQ